MSCVKFVDNEGGENRKNHQELFLMVDLIINNFFQTTFIWFYLTF